jgi:hypothetical protein
MNILVAMKKLLPLFSFADTSASLLKATKRLTLWPGSQPRDKLKWQDLDDFYLFAHVGPLNTVHRP